MSELGDVWFNREHRANEDCQAQAVPKVYLEIWDVMESLV